MVMTDRQMHWQRVYQTKAADSVSWYRQHLDVSLELLEQAGLSAQCRLVDIGGGASTLVDDLLGRGLKSVTVLDISAEALAIPKVRLGERARDVRWLVGDVLHVALPADGFDFWHDRAVFHFLTDPAEPRDMPSRRPVPYRRADTRSSADLPLTARSDAAVCQSRGDLQRTSPGY
jgi:SAM-dependent methyltransferase